MKRILKFINWIFDVMLRLVFGAIGIYALNSIFIWTKWDVSVGINYKTLGTVGLLGVPGFIALYGIMFCLNEVT